MICINCGSSDVIREGDDFSCNSCRHKWDVAHEQANANYLKSQGRQPAEPMTQPADQVDEDYKPELGDYDQAYLEALTVTQLIDMADTHEIDLGGATKKADIIAAIQMSQEED